MHITIDTREQTPLKFIGVETSSKKIDFGDYSCILSDGHVVPVVFERKSVCDLFGTMSVGYERFRNEINRCKESNFKMIIIIEGVLTKVSKGISHSCRSGDSVLSQLFTIWIKYDITPVFCKDQEESSKFITLFYTAFEKKYWVEKNSTLTK